MMNCKDVNSKMADLFFETEVSKTDQVQLDAKVNSPDLSEAHAHLAACSECTRQLEELRATMSLLDTWEAPEPNPYFLTRLNARLDEEREAVPVGWPMSWYEKLRARLVYGSRRSLRPVAAMAMTAVVLLGGGAYLGLNELVQPAPQPQAAVVQDMQTLDNNAQLLDQLESLSSQNDDDGSPQI
ncbi:MAG TPA: hypothetical protein VHZ52_05200 [Acidobacteriaceae bacterium]|jgi:hypothetical protein|nr:hypothetical protein [Acidobacteriaceae bacterium]